MNLSELGSAISLDESTNTVQTENLRLLQIILTEEITTKGLTPDPAKHHTVRQGVRSLVR